MPWPSPAPHLPQYSTVGPGLGDTGLGNTGLGNNLALIILSLGPGTFATKNTLQPETSRYHDICPTLLPSPGRYTLNMAKRKTISNEKRRQLRAYYRRQTPRPTQKACIKWFQREHGMTISQPTVSDTLSPHYAHLDENELTEAPSVANWPELEEALMKWQMRVEERGGFTSGPILKEKALQLWQRLPQYSNLPPPSFSNGWLDGFKKRHKLRNRIQHGEAGSVATQAEDEMKAIATIAGDYEEDDIYNMDETGLFWRMVPSRGLLTSRQPGFKKNKDRISLVFCTNASGSDRFPVWMIRRAKTPRCLRHQSITTMGGVWNWNKKAWMTTEIMMRWLEAFYNHIGSARRVLLTLDNFSAHAAALQLKPAPTNIRVMFLPANATSRFQALDQGIIQSFKAQYRKKWLKFMLEEWDAERDPLDTMNLLFSIRWALESWFHDVTNTTIYNCFQKSTIVQNPIQLPIAITPPDLQGLYYRVGRTGNIHDLMDINNFLNPEGETEPEKAPIANTEEDIFEEIAEEYSDIYTAAVAPVEDEEVYGELPEQPPSALAAVQFAQGSLKFMESSEAVDTKLLRQQQVILRLFKQLALDSTQQSTLDSWIS